MWSRTHGREPRAHSALSCAHVWLPHAPCVLVDARPEILLRTQHGADDDELHVLFTPALDEVSIFRDTIRGVLGEVGACSVETFRSIPRIERVRIF